MSAVVDPTTALDGWEMVIGLEVHAELATETKMFSGAPNQFGDEPNTNIDPVSLGLPGSLPVLNEKAVELAIRLGLALHCEIRPSVFARKNYFYPDMPKDFQISQYDQPIDADGWLELPSGTRVGIERAHLEEDTGKSTHVGGGRAHHRRRPTRSSTTTAPASRSWRSCRGPTCATRPMPGRTSPSSAPSSSPPV